MWEVSGGYAMHLVSKTVAGLSFAIYLLDHYQRQVWSYLIGSGLSLSLIQVLKDADCHLGVVNCHLLCHLSIYCFDFMIDKLHTHIITSCEDQLVYIINLVHICLCVTLWENA